MTKFNAIWFSVAVLFTAISCGTVKYVPVKTTEYVSVHDTTYLHRTDTLVKVPEIRYKDFTGLLDTLSIRTSISEFRAYCDTTAGVLRGDVTQSGTIPVQIVWKERVVTRDSLVYQDVPVPVVEEKIVKVTPKWAWWALVVSVLSIALFLFYAYSHLKP